MLISDALFKIVFNQILNVYFIIMATCIYLVSVHRV